MTALGSFWLNGNAGLVAPWLCFQAYRLNPNVHPDFGCTYCDMFTVIFLCLQQRCGTAKWCKPWMTGLNTQGGYTHNDDLRLYPFLTTEDYLLSYKIILHDYPVVCGVLRVVLRVCSDNLLGNGSRPTIVNVKLVQYLQWKIFVWGKPTTPESLLREMWRETQRSQPADWGTRKQT